MELEWKQIELFSPSVPMEKRFLYHQENRKAIRMSSSVSIFYLKTIDNWITFPFRIKHFFLFSLYIRRATEWWRDREGIMHGVSVNDYHRHNTKRPFDRPKAIADKNEYVHILALTISRAHTQSFKAPFYHSVERYNKQMWCTESIETCQDKSATSCEHTSNTRLKNETKKKRKETSEDENWAKWVSKGSLFCYFLFFVFFLNSMRALTRRIAKSTNKKEKQRAREKKTQPQCADKIVRETVKCDR